MARRAGTGAVLALSLAGLHQPVGAHDRAILSSLRLDMSPSATELMVLCSTYSSDWNPGRRAAAKAMAAMVRRGARQGGHATVDARARRGLVEPVAGGHGLRCNVPSIAASR
jgi:hypothetical protein